MGDGPADAFGEFYDRHEDAVLAYFLRRSDSAELAADLTAETFSRAVLWREDYDPERVDAAAWILGIAHEVFDESYRLGRVSDHARRRLELGAVTLSAAVIERIEALREE